MDLIVGVVLAAFVPVLCLIVAGAAGLTTRSAKFDFREKIETDPPFDREEVDMRLKSIQDLYLSNAKPYLENAEKTKDAAVKLNLLRWATGCLVKAESALGELESRIQDDGRKSPENLPSVQGYLPQIAGLRADVQRDLAKAREMDTLGLIPAQR